MEYHIEYVPSPKLIAEGARRVWLRKNGMGYLYYYGVPFLALILCLASPQITSSRQGNLCIGVLLGVVAMACFSFLHALLNFEKSARKSLQQRGLAPIRMIFDEEGIQFESDGYTGSYKWKKFVSLWQHPHNWLLFYGTSQFVSIPLDSLNDEVQQFITRKVSESGGKITH